MEMILPNSFAIKVLGLTCSASACERNWSTFNQVHTKRRNRLTTERMNDLVYTMYNRKLKNKFIKKSTLKEGDDPLVVENVMSDDEWIADPSGDESDIGGDEPNEEESDEPIRTTRGGGPTKTRRGGGTIEKGDGSSSNKRKTVQTMLIDEDDDDDDADWVEEDCEDDEDGEFLAI
ncbi:putative HAT dimerization domain, ribonuclease H-like superfamily [Helianthus annuus]|uniref:HAT dimerization domain, ribonuclease H-like superfamily n=1 Tax=Helianthus annuus TaxID=4232 RepID=A0A9K3J7T4_HELAN|nr:putative HAT dimerization domain, ribonuclease H-like superfamily [Helianthus annuus]KAJ0761561.1 putative HAT dimerization domain, ribonuclease H-like superfamily [Helianthus annuus]KAJ0931562.1 putative HAT dimerization domain, ribonuclease H-like superfamily [Helianthus annuus]